MEEKLHTMGLHEDLIKGFFDERDDSIKIDLEKVEDVLVIKLAGYIDTYNSNFFMKQMNKVLENGFYKIVFDCANISYISSTGIGSFTAVLKIAKARGGELAFYGMLPKVYEIFSLLGFSQFFRIVETKEDAIAYVNGNNKVDFTEPYITQCPVCQKRLMAKKPGRFRCPGCKTIVSINNQKQIALG